MTDAVPQREVSTRSAPMRGRPRAAAAWALGQLAAGLRGVCGPRSDQTFGILMYHRVSEVLPGVATPTWNVTPAQLRAQLTGLLARRFAPWPLARLLAAREDSLPLPANVFAVTFDDGYANNLLAALPVLRELNVPTTVFLATGYLDSRVPFPFDDWSATGSPQVPVESWRALTTGECHEMLASGLISFGAHTHTHQRFVGRTAEFRQDMTQCLETLREKFGIERPPFALPYGATHPALIEAARQSGVTCCLTTVARPVQAGDDPFDWGRFDVGAWETPGALAGKLSGWYHSVATAGKAMVRPLKTWQSRRGSPASLAS